MKLPPWHSKTGRVYHLCTTCAIGKKITPKKRVNGQGGRPLCDECVRRLQNGRC